MATYNKDRIFQAGEKEGEFNNKCNKLILPNPKMTQVKAFSICPFLIQRPIGHCCCCSVAQCVQLFETQPHGLWHTRLPCPSLLLKFF